MRKYAPTLIFSLACCTELLEAQSPPIRALGKPAVEFDVELSTVTGIRELADGRAVVLDAKERIVHLLDPATGSATRIGREGSGPGEYVRPFALLALPGDSTLITDFGNTRFLVLGPGGRILGNLPLVQIKPQEGVTYSVTMRGVDGNGRMYFELPTGLIVNKERGTPLLRLDRRTQRSDTIGYLLSPAAIAAPSRPTGTEGVRFGVNAPTPFAAVDDWTVAPNGAVAFVRANPYRVEWRSPTGTTTSGPAIAYERIRVDDAEKDQWREQARLRGGPTLTTRGANGRTQQQRLPVPEPTAWPEFKAPFSAPASLVAPDGRVWVRRALRAKHPTTEYDVFDASGKLVERVTMPSSSSVAGFGKSSVYVAHKDEDDLLHLRRHPLP